MSIRIELPLGITISKTLPVVISSYDPSTKQAGIIISGSVATMALVTSGTDEEVAAVVTRKDLALDPNGSISAVAPSKGIASIARSGSSHYIDRPIR